jgi:hypothetical protein
MSDGVHDNLEPHVFGQTPASLSPQHPGVEKWADLDRMVAMELKTAFMEDYLTNKLILGGEEDRKVRAKVFIGSSEEDPMTPAAISSRILKHCLNLTSKGREWMEQNPKKKLPPHLLGKMDHCTTAIFQVTSYDAIAEKLFKTSKERPFGKFV